MSFRFSKQPIRLGVIITALALSVTAFALNSSKWIEVVGGAWSPDVAMLSELETALKPAVVNASMSRGHLPEWNEYKFQYQGRSPVLGKRYVFVNAFCDEVINHPDLQNKWVNVFDGGACFFSAKYEPDSKRLFDIKVNGLA